MSDVVLMLGPIAFQDFEVPASVWFGGAQRLAVHRLVGGTRVIDALGRDDGQINFAGTFSGPDATWRARTLDELRAAGGALPLTWDVFFYTVLISSFQANYCNGWWIPYRISCVVLRDEAASLLPMIVPLAASVAADATIAVDQALGAGLDLSPIQASLAAAQATTRGTAAYAAAQSSLVAANTDLTVAIGGTESELANSEPSRVTDPDEGARRLAGATDVAGRLSALTMSRSYVSRAAINLANANT